MFVSSPGFVLRSHSFKDNKFISKVFTREKGVVSFIFKKTKNHIILSQPLTMLDITYRAPKNKQLFYATETHVNYVYQSILFNNSKMNHSIILCEILYKCLSETNEKLFDFIIESFKWLDQNYISPALFNNYFLIKLCEKAGISPFSEPKDTLPSNYMLNVSEGVFVKGPNTITNKNLVPHPESVEMYNLSKLSLDELAGHKITQNMNSSIFLYIIQYLSSHLTDVSSIKSISIIREIS
tara:strand:+ start:804 stop:1520 length:717 start_codon:yes stop_codon:yes gene_type:complete